MLYIIHNASIVYNYVNTAHRDKRLSCSSLLTFAI